MANNDDLSYRSEIADHSAKALFAFSEFRLLGTENRWDEALIALERAIKFDPQSNYLRLLLAKVYLHRHLPEPAIATLNVLFGRDFNDPDAHELLGDIYNFQRDFVAALDQFQHVLELQPQRETAQLRLAMTFVLLEQKDQAIIALKKYLKVSPGTEAAQLTLARLYVEKKQYDQAGNIYRAVMELNPAQFQAVIEYGTILEEIEPDMAGELYRRVLAKNPRSIAVRLKLGQYLLDRRQLDDALLQFKLVLQQYPDNLKTIKRIGLIYLEQNDWVAAEKLFLTLISDNEPYSRNRYYLSLALVAQQKEDDAIRVLESLGADPTPYPAALLQLAYLYNKAYRTSKAISTLQWLLDHDIHQSDVYYYLVAFLDESGDRERALKFALTGVAKNPQAIQLQYQLGVLYDKLGDRSDAVITMEKILVHDADHADALNFLAYAQAESGNDLPLALIRVKKALVKNQNGYVIDTLGWIYFKMGRYEESRIELEKAIKIYPDDAVIREHLGDLYRALELWDKAIATYRIAINNSASIAVKEKLRVLLLERNK